MSTLVFFNGFEEISYIKCYINPSLGYCAVPCEEMDIRADNIKLVVAARFASASKLILDGMWEKLRSYQMWRSTILADSAASGLTL